ncbi:MAG: hypothetical protein EOM46_24130, partial [Gammaproteobacteria bacterium]|nr:hypothetical protein [Gammaproteobacteria bacterium]
MSKVQTITRESWILNTFPEWGSWLNEEIEQEQVAPGTFAMWWLGCTGIWLKSEGGANICVDLWIGWGVPKERCIVMKPGDVVKIKDVEIHAIAAFERTALIT